MEVAGIRVCRLQSSPTTTGIRSVWRWHRLRHCIARSAEHRCIGVKQVKVSCSDPRSLKRLNDKCRLSVRIWKWLSPDRKVTQTLEGKSWPLKKENMCIWKCHLSEGCTYSRSKGNCHLVTLAHSGSWNEKAWLSKGNCHQLELPAWLSDVHNVFHISQLKKCLRVLEEQLSLEELERITRSKRIRMGKVKWSHHAEDEATWEREDEL